MVRWLSGFRGSGSYERYIKGGSNKKDFFKGFYNSYLYKVFLLIYLLQVVGRNLHAMGLHLKEIIPVKPRPVGRPRKPKKHLGQQVIKISIGSLREVLEGDKAHHKRTPQVAKKILKTFAQGYTETRAAQVAGVSRQLIQNWVREDKDFAALVQSAKEQGIQRLEDELTDRTMNGQYKYVTYMGRVMDKYKEFDNGLLRFNLQAKHPGYRVNEQASVNINVDLGNRLDAALNRMKTIDMQPNNPGGSNA